MRRTAVALTALALLGAAAATLAAGSLQQDFAAFFTAGRALARGLDPYQNHLGSALAPALWDGSLFRHSRFLYPPLAGEVFRPLATLPFVAAKLVFSIGALAALVAAAVIGTAPRPGGRAADPRRMLIGAALFFPTYLHFDRGQVDLYLLPLLLAAWRWRDRPVAAGGLLAAAACFKPALFIVVPVVVALGRARLAVAAVAGAVVLTGLSVVVVGPQLVSEYAREVLPRAALYGEGGTEAMLLPAAEEEAARLGLSRDGGDRVFVESRGYEPSLLERLMPWPVRASASLPRLFAPDGPSRGASVGPAIVALFGLVSAARVWLRRRRAETRASIEDDDAEALLFVSALVGSVVTSPVGWTMGLVWALPLLDPLARLHAAGRVPRRIAAVLIVAGLACALPAPFPGLSAVAGTALGVAGAAAALGSFVPPTS